MRRRKKKNEYQSYEIEYIKNIEQKIKDIVIKNSLSIPEVENYTYLGIKIIQSLKLKDHENKLRNMKNFISTRVNIMARYIKNTLARRSYTKWFWNRSEATILKL